MLHSCDELLPFLWFIRMFLQDLYRDKYICRLHDSLQCNSTLAHNLANAPHCDIEATGPIILIVRMNGGVIRIFYIFCFISMNHRGINSRVVCQDTGIEDYWRFIKTKWYQMWTLWQQQLMMLTILHTVPDCVCFVALLWHFTRICQCNFTSTGVIT